MKSNYFKRLATSLALCAAALIVGGDLASAQGRRDRQRDNQDQSQSQQPQNERRRGGEENQRPQAEDQ